MSKSFKAINTDKAPSAIGTYSQAVKAGGFVFISGQIPLVPGTPDLVVGDFKAQLVQAFDNLSEVAIASGGDLSKLVKLTIYLLDLSNFAIVNEVMAGYFNEPYPARAALGVSSLPKDAHVEIEAIMII